MTLPLVSVITVNLNGRHHLESLLPTLVDQDFHRGTFEILLVDNGSDDGSTGAAPRAAAGGVHEESITPETRIEGSLFADADLTFLEELNALRASLEVSLGRSARRVLGFTGSAPDEGATTVAAHFAQPTLRPPEVSCSHLATPARAPVARRLIRSQPPGSDLVDVSRTDLVRKQRNSPTGHPRFRGDRKERNRIAPARCSANGCSLPQ